MRSRDWGLCVLLVGFAVLALPGFALGAAGGAGAGFTNPGNIQLILDVANVNLGTATPGTAQVFSSAITTTVTSSANNWSLTLDAPDFSDGLGNTVPINRLTMSPAGAGTWTPVSAAGLTLLSGMPKNNPTGASYSWDFQLNVTSADPTSANQFTTTLTFTAF